MHREFHRPLSAPTSMPVPIATGKMAQVPRWEAAMAPRVAERAALAPTDRSVLPMAVTDDNGKSLAHNVGNILGSDQGAAGGDEEYAEQDEEGQNGNKRIDAEFLFHVITSIMVSSDSSALRGRSLQISPSFMTAMVSAMPRTSESSSVISRIAIPFSFVLPISLLISDL